MAKIKSQIREESKPVAEIVQEKKKKRPEDSY